MGLAIAYLRHAHPCAACGHTKAAHTTEEGCSLCACAFYSPALADPQGDMHIPSQGTQRPASVLPPPDQPRCMCGCRLSEHAYPKGGPCRRCRCIDFIDRTEFRVDPDDACACGHAKGEHHPDGGCRTCTCVLYYLPPARFANVEVEPADWWSSVAEENGETVVGFEPENVRRYLDHAIRHARRRVMRGDEGARHAVDALQSARTSIFGECLPYPAKAVATTYQHLPEDERGLWQSAKEAGDLAAREALVAHYRDLAFWTRRGLQERGRLPGIAGRHDLADLDQEALRALIEAVDRFDPQHPRRTRFSTFATLWVRGKLLNYWERVTRIRRHERGEGAFALPLLETLRRPASEPSCEDTAVSNLFAASVLSRIQAMLPAREYRIFVVRCLGERSVAETARIVGCSPFTVKVLTRRVKEKLQQVVLRLGLGG